LARFEALGLPSARQENWKYTNVAPIERRTFKVRPEATAAAINAYEIGALQWQSIDRHELVFINGRFSAERSFIGELPPGVRIESMATALATDAPGLRNHIQRVADLTEDGFSALNTAFLTDGAYLQLNADAVASKPVHLLFVITAEQDELAQHPRIVVLAGPNSRVAIVESYVSLSTKASLTNTLTEIIADADASVDHFKVQRESATCYHIGRLHIRQGRDSQVRSHSFSFGAALARNDIAVDLAETGATTALNGLYMVKGRQHVDNHTRIDHSRPHTRSEEFYKGILDGHARAVFNGTVVVHEGAQKTDARQGNANLLLSDNAEIDTKPELQIYADDVKCSHGATVGQLDDDALFYLRARGIEATTARSLLTFAFARELLNRVPIAALREHLEAVLIEQFPDAEVLKRLL
jgi:Fe-S cluster assembly protein SufD